MPTAHKPIVYPTANMLDFPTDVTQCADIRQGPLGTCWLIAPLIAAEVAAPGFCDRTVVHRTATRAVVDAGTAPITTNIPAHARDRSGSRAGKVNSATLVEAAAQTVLGSRLKVTCRSGDFSFFSVRRVLRYPHFPAWPSSHFAPPSVGLRADAPSSPQPCLSAAAST